MTSARFKVLSVLVMAATVLGACATSTPATSGPSIAPGQATTAAPPPTQAAGGVLRISYHEDFLTLDPTGETQTSVQIFVRANVFDGLLTRDDNGQIQPGLAESWTSVDDNTWEFKLRQGVKFHNGEPFNAEAVKFTFDHYLDPNFNSRLTTFFFTQVEGVEIVDDNTVRIKTKVPFGPLLANLTMTAMVPPKAYNAESAKTNPIGTGPFKFVEWKPGEQLVLEANDEYWGGRPKVDKVVWYTIPEATTRLAALRAGDVDIIFGVSPDDLPALKADPSLKVQEVPGTDTPVISVGGKRAPYDNPKVREAISLAIDRQLIVDSLLTGIAEPARSVLSPDVFGFNPSLPPLKYDEARAKALMIEAGYPTGFNATLIVPIGAHPKNVDVAQVIQQQLGKIGITVKVDATAADTIWDVLHSGDFDLFWNGWSTTTLDADYNLYGNFHSVSREGMNDQQIDKLLEAARSSPDQKERERLYWEVQDLILAANYRIPIVHLLDQWGMSAKVQGFTPRPDRIIHLSGVSLAP